MSGLVTNILIGVAMVLLLGLSIFLQIVRTRRSPLGRVVGTLSSVKYNMKLCENFSYHRSIGRMKSKAWEKNRDNVVFLPQGLMDDLSKLFEMVAEVNEMAQMLIVTGMWQSWLCHNYNPRIYFLLFKVKFATALPPDDSLFRKSILFHD